MNQAFGNGTCLVTGVAGFVGSHLAGALLGRGHRVVGVDNFSTGTPEDMAGFAGHPGFTFHEATIAEPGLIAKLCKDHPGLGMVFHLAGVAGAPYSMEHEQETMEIDFASAVRLLREAEQAGVRRFILAGSAAEYGSETRLPLKEEYASDDTRQPSPYGRAKYLASRAVARSPIGVSLRLFNIYGPRLATDGRHADVVCEFAALALGGHSLTIHGDGTQSRDFLFIDDAVRACLAAMGPSLSGVYNVGTGTAATILELALKIRELTGNSRPLLFLPSRQGDIPHSLADTTAFHGATGWEPAMNIGQGLRLTLKWMREAVTDACLC